MTARSPTERASILLVEDDPTVRQAVALKLERSGYDVTTAVNGLDALARIAEATPDLVVSDILMPELGGLGLLEQLRADPTTAAIPVIMLTSKGTTEDVVTGLDLGADDYLVKPFQMIELLARVRAKVERPPMPSELLPLDRRTGLLDERTFLEEVRRELARSSRGGAMGCLAYISLAEMPRLSERLGARAEAEIAKQVADVLCQKARDLDLLGRDRQGRFGMLLPETSAESAERLLAQISQRIMAHTFKAAGGHVRLTPAIGYADFGKGLSRDQVQEHALIALEHAARQLDLVPRRYEPTMAPIARQPETGRRWASRLLTRWRDRLRTPWQIALTYILGFILPFTVYAGLDAAGHDITPWMYYTVVIALALTAFFIWVEGFKALKVVHPPEDPTIPYPPASAIIAAYLPNEAPTIFETIEKFLALEYPHPLQVILAYNTPRDMPAEELLRDIARRDPRFLPLKVEGSTSKAQNVNAALAEVRGEFVGLFDADHHPERTAFMRAWRWLASGYDVVQGHCVVRNGDASWKARLVAVEFEAIYAVSHPGRERLHRFGIFGGSNGYWKTDLLRRTRMREFMLTEDIDSSLRVTQEGYKIASDPLLLSRELATLTLKAFWNQRLRWAQGWFQVSRRHIVDAMRSESLSWRQKWGVFWLLGWREIYPWLSLQIFPLVAYWAVKYGGLDRLDWLIPIFVLTTLFTLSVGPGQALFAYRLAAPEIRARKGWFLFYLLMAPIFFVEFKNLIGRVAQTKELMSERQWKVTPRESVKKPGHVAG